MTTLYSLTDWQHHSEHDHPVLWDDLVGVEGRVHIIADYMRAFSQAVSDQLEEPYEFVEQLLSS